MRKEFGVLFFFLAFCIFANLSMPKEWARGFSLRRSDWSDSPCDYSTNAAVHNFYHPEARGYRTNRFERIYQTPLGNFPEEILNKVFKGDTVRIGFDYYSLTGVSAGIVPNVVLKKDFSKGQVYVYRMYKDSTRVLLEEL